MYNITTFNSISNKIGTVLEKEKYLIVKEGKHPNAIIARSYDLRNLTLGEDLYCIARAGAGVNTIPVDRCSEQGIVVFNTPGANANAVKEMVLASMVIATRNVLESIEWTDKLKGNGDDVPGLAEKGKNQFVGKELKGMTLGVIGLGAIGALVAEAAINLGMNVIGTDPHLSLSNAIHLSNKIKVVSEEEVLANSDIITIHAPLTEETNEKYNADFISKTKEGVVLLNFSRAQIANFEDIKDALLKKRIKKYIVDFPTEELLGVQGVISMPHLASGTFDAEENCAIMAAESVHEYLANGSIVNSVNFPNCVLDNCKVKQRITICHKNVKGIINQFTSVISQDASINISNMTNKSKGDYAYTVLDIDEIIESDIFEKIKTLPGVLKVRAI